MKSILGSLAIALFCSYASATDVKSHTFLPFVVIAGSSTDAIEIRTKQQIFTATYSVERQSFLPLSIPFEVVSLNGEPLNYRLTLPISIHQCEETGLFGVDVTLGGEHWPALGRVFNGSLNEHQMDLTFERVLQVEGVKQDCFGSLSVQVEVETL